MDPKLFPPTDAAEQESIAVLLNLIDHQYIKADIQHRSNYPNIDGNVAVVDDQNVPIAKLEVQVKKIGDNQTKYSCPSTLVTYSQFSTLLPVLLICVDTTNKRAFWKHIFPSMPEYKPNQASSTIHFSEVSDAIDSRGIYIQKWVEIYTDYKKRLANSPTVTAEMVNQLQMTGISAADKRYFQKFIDTVNSLLDNDFITIKELLYPGIWKLGVGIVSSDPTFYRYQIYKIPEDEPAIPLVSKIKDESLFAGQWDPKVIMTASSSRDFARDPVEAAKNSVYRDIGEIIEQKELPIYGPLLSADILIAFIDRYYRCIGVQPYEDSYSVEDLAHGLNVFLYQACLAYIDNLPISPKAIIYIDLDDFDRFLVNTKVTSLTQARTPVNFLIASRDFPIKAVFSSLRYLQANGIRQINRIFGVADRTPPKGRSWVWSRYTPENEIRSVTRVLSNAINAYTLFVSGNHLRLSDSPYLDSSTAIIYEYEPAGSRLGHEGPGLKEYHAQDAREVLPKLSVIVRDPLEPRIDSSEFPTIKFNGEDFHMPMSSSTDATYLFLRAPVYNHLMQMLADDLYRHYELRIHPHNL